MQILTVAQPWAMLLARGSARFAVRHDATDYRGTIGIRAGREPDHEMIARMAEEPELAEHLATFGLDSPEAIHALPREAIVGVAAIADLWSLGALEEVATETDAVLFGEVGEFAVFWELAECVEIEPVSAPDASEDEEDVDTSAAEDDVDGEVAAEGDADADADADAEGVLPDSVEADAADEVDFEPPLDPPFEAAADDLAHAVRSAAERAGARFDEDGIVFLPVHPSASLAVLIGDDADNDREITRRVWAHVVEHDLQDAEDHAWVYLDDPLRMALDTNEDGMTTVEFTARIVSQMLRTPSV